MTTEQTTDTTEQPDPITQTQEQLEVEAPQESDDSGQAALLTRVEAAEKRAERAEAEARGAQSKVDRGLNSIRREYAERAAQSDIERELADVPEDMRPYMERMYRRFGTPNQQEGQAPDAGSDDQMTKIHGFVRDFGVDPDDERINYGVLYQGGLTDEQRQSQFVQSLRHIVEQGPSQPATQPEPTPPQPETPPSPPVENAPGQGAPGMDVEALREAFITGQLGLDDYRQRMAVLGERI